MNKFCTNCGHANDNENQICVECGNLLENEQQMPVPPQPTAPRQPKKPMTFKAKLLTVISIALIASCVSFYSWGTKAASAETAVSKFLEAVQGKDAAELRKYLVLSTGKKPTEKEAEAFIELYQGFSADELNEMTRVEKKGKLAGVFDAHKIVLSPQYVSFYFPYEGLNLKLNGEETKADFNAEGEYIFSGIVPGQYEAEFAFDNGQTVFEHPFELTVNYQEDSTYIATIDEYLPLGSAVFSVEVEGSAPQYEAKVVIGETEYPVDEYGQTEEIGPFLFDGSMSATASVAFPWGTTTTEAVPIEEEYVNIDITKVDEETEEQVLEQYMTFLEEYLQASAFRNASVYTFLTPGLVKSSADDFESWEARDYYFRGSLTKVNLDAESVGFWSEGVSVDAEVVLEGENYYGSDKSDLETRKVHSRVEFAYDTDIDKWIVKKHNVTNNYSRSFTLEPIRSIEGSQKLYEYNGPAVSAKETKEESDEVEKKDETVESEETEQDVDLTAANLKKFFQDFRGAYEQALNSKDFTKVAGYLQTGSIAYKEMEEFVGDLGTDYFLYDFSINNVVDVELSGQTAYLTTYEEFDFTNHLGKTVVYKRDKLYEVLVKDGEVFEIVSIQIQDTERSN